MHIDHIGVKYGTDKSSIGHNYLKHYGKYLPSRVHRLLEVGCEMGESLRMWKEIYPNAEIHTIDLFQNPNFASERDMKDEGFFTHRGDQFYRKTYDSLEGKFDVIIEDGSHNANHQIFSFYMLFENHLKSEGLYVLEDLHCCKDTFFLNGMSSLDQTILPALKNKGSWFYAQYGQSIEWIELFDDNIAFIKKRI